MSGHWLVVELSRDHVALVLADETEGRNHECDEYCYGYGIECDGVTDHCMMWEYCSLEECVEEVKAAEKHYFSLPATAFPIDDDITEREIELLDETVMVSHGREHEKFDGDWYIRSGLCLSQGLEAEHCGEIAVERGPGRWPVELEMPEETSWYVMVNDLTEGEPS